MVSGVWQTLILRLQGVSVVPAALTRPVCALKGDKKT